MKKFSRFIKLSGVGMFCTGIIAVIQGCSIQKEGVLAAVLLVLLQFCSGPGSEPMVEPPCTFPTCIEPFTVTQNISFICDGTSTSKRIDNSFPWVKREILDGTSGGGTITASVGNGKFQVSVTGGACNYSSTQHLIGWFNNFVDLSSFTTIRIPVLKIVNGPITNCNIKVNTSAATPNPFSISAVGNIDLNISNITRNLVQNLQIENCDLPSDVEVEFGPFLLL